MTNYTVENDIDKSKIVTSLRKFKIVTSLRKILPGWTTEAELLSSWLERLGEDRLVIANAGPMNPGKSTLFNALLDSPEAFGVSDRRETVECKEVSWGRKYVLLDTPGFDSSSSSDDQKAISGLQKADMVMFVHNVNTGGLLEAELTMLRIIQGIFQDEMETRVWMLCTRTDEIDDDDILARNSNEIQKQLQGNLGLTMQILKVAPPLHFKAMEYKHQGRLGDAEVMEKLSGIEGFRKKLREVATKLGRRGGGAIQALNGKLLVEHSSAVKKAAEKLQRWKKRQSSSKESWKETMEAIRSAWEPCKGPSIEDDLQSLIDDLN